MRIRVNDVRSREDGPRAVLFSSAVGAASGTWANEHFEPIIGREYDVEFTINEPWVFGDTLFFSKDRQASVRQDNAQVVLTGEVESVDENGVISFRLAPDSLTMLDPANVAMPTGSWIRLQFDARLLLVFAHDAL
jgi:hypothetical protein